MKTHTAKHLQRQLLLSFLLFGWLLSAQSGEHLFRVTFCDKQGSAYTLDHPEAFLSQRALERRHRQHIVLDSTDLPLSSVYVDAVKARGVKVVSASKWNNSVLVGSHSLDTLQALSALSFVTRLESVGEVPDTFAAYDYPRRTKNFEPLKGNENATDQQLEMIHLDRLHRAGYRGRGLMIAVLDGGYLYADRIPAILHVNKLGSRDFVYPPSENIYREHAHGTKVLSVMAVNEKGIYEGAAPEADYWLLRCEQSQSESRAEEDFWTAAAEFADSVGVDIINSSLGYNDFDDDAHNYPYSALDGRTMMMSRMASLLAGKGIVMVCSAGNTGDDTWKKITIPADAKDVLAVGAVTPDGLNASFSSVGPTADGRVKPDVMAMGGYCQVVTANGKIETQNGTSFASPLIAGGVACLWQACPDKSARDIIRSVRQSGDRAAMPDNIFGYGIPNFEQAQKMAEIPE